MARTTFQGPVRSLGGIYQQGPAAVVDITTSTTLSPEAHGGRIIAVGGSLAAAVTLTLPAINTSSNPTTSGPGQDPSTANNEGVVYTIWVPTTIATSSLKIGTNGTNKFVGTIRSRRCGHCQRCHGLAQSLPHTHSCAAHCGSRAHEHLR